MTSEAGAEPLAAAQSLANDDTGERTRLHIYRTRVTIEFLQALGL